VAAHDGFVFWCADVDLIHSSAIFDEKESEDVRDRHASLQWVALLFKVFLDCFADETLQNIYFQEISVDKKLQTL